LLESAADQREALSGPDHGPLSLISGAVSSEGEKSVKGGRGCRRSEPLTDFSPSVQSRPRERGPGVSGGLSPWRSMRQRLMRASARRPFRIPRFSPGFSMAPKLLSARLPFTPEVSPRFHPHSPVPVTAVPIGVLDTRGAAISVTACGVPIARFSTTTRDPAVTPTRRFRISRRFRSFRLILNYGLVILAALRCCFCFPLGFRRRCLRQFAVVSRVVHFPRHPQVM